MPLTYNVYNDSTHIHTKWLAEALGWGSISKNFFPISIRFNHKIWPFPPESEVFVARILENKSITSFRQLRGTNFKRNS